MKRIISVLLVLAMLMTCSAFAETQISHYEGAVRAGDSITNNVLFETLDDYLIFDPTTDEVWVSGLHDAGLLSNGYWWFTYNKSVMNNTNLLRKDGTVVAEGYEDYLVFRGSDWVIGFKAASDTANPDAVTRDYSARYTDLDFFYRDEPRFSFQRNDWMTSFDDVKVYGAYIEWKVGETLVCFDMDGNMLNQLSGEDFGEFTFWTDDSDSRVTRVVHMPTGQDAFCEGCTLTEDEVVTPIWALNGQIVDLQGHVLATYDSTGTKFAYAFKNGYAILQMLDGTYRLLSADGTIYGSADCDPGWSYNEKNFLFGYQYTTSADGSKFGFIDINGNETVPVEYDSAMTDASQRGPLVWYVEDDGTNKLISAAKGDLGAFYDIRTASGLPVAIVGNSDGEAGVIDMYGEMLVPFSKDYNLNSFVIANDASVIACNGIGMECTIYLLDEGRYTFASETTEPEPAPASDVTPKSAFGGWFGGNKDAQPTPEATSEPAPEAAPEAAPAAGEWTCSCGTVSSGNFCPDCGQPRPAGTTCIGCGTIFENDVPNFCPNCGTKLK